MLARAPGRRAPSAITHLWIVLALAARRGEEIGAARGLWRRGTQLPALHQ
jgi:hypothetical protein